MDIEKFLSDSEHFSVFDKVVQEGNWLEGEPTHYSKMCAGMARKWMMDTLYKQWIRLEEEVAIAQGHKPHYFLANAPAYQLMNNFIDYAKGALDEYTKQIEEDEEGENPLM